MSPGAPGDGRDGNEHDGDEHDGGGASRDEQGQHEVEAHARDAERLQRHSVPTADSEGVTPSRSQGALRADRGERDDRG